MSWAFTVAPDGDRWDDSFTQRVITKVATIWDVAAVGEPASPTTSIELLEFPSTCNP